MRAMVIVPVCWPDGLFAHKKDGHLSLCMLGLGGKVVVPFL